MNIKWNSQFIEFSCLLFIHCSTFQSLKNATGFLCCLINTCDYPIRTPASASAEKSWSCPSSRPWTPLLCGPLYRAISLPVAQLLRVKGGGEKDCPTRDRGGVLCTLWILRGCSWPWSCDWVTSGQWFSYLKYWQIFFSSSQEEWRSVWIWE